MPEVPKPLALVILDGFGLNDKEEGNAVKAAKTPNFDKLSEEYPFATLNASGEDVGLPEGQMGNSEVGHLNLGAGRIVYQDLTRINLAIEESTLSENEVLIEAMTKAKENDSALHLLGLLSDGGVHSHIRHLFGLLEFAKAEGIEDVYVHAILDGRDVAPRSAKKYVKQLEDKMDELGVGEIVTIGGRYYYMDRDKRWDRTALAYNTMCFGEGESAETALEAIENSYQQDKTDEFVLPTVIEKDGEPLANVADDDSIIFFNFRPDRARQLTRALNDKEFDHFERKSGYPEVHLVCMTEYDETIDAPIAFEQLEVKNTFGNILSDNGLKQLRIAETEKYAHVTFFFNGGKEVAYEGEDRKLIQSPKEVDTYDQAPKMSAKEVTDNLMEQMDETEYDVIILNFANPDMVGHTGKREAVITALETVDECLGRVVDEIREKDGALLVTADHGNSEQLLDYETGEPFTAHTSNPVPLIYINDNEKDVELIDGGKLADIAPTMLNLLDIDIPEEIEGDELIKR